jgi:hypothetical protein
MQQKAATESDGAHMAVPETAPLPGGFVIWITSSESCVGHNAFHAI